MGTDIFAHQCGKWCTIFGHKCKRLTNPQLTNLCPAHHSHYSVSSQQPEDQFPLIMTCHHRSCLECLRQYLRIEIMESRVNIACPECAEKFHPNDIKMILAEDDLMRKYEEFMLRRVMVSEPDARWCSVVPGPRLRVRTLMVIINRCCQGELWFQNLMLGGARPPTAGTYINGYSEPDARWCPAPDCGYVH